MAYPIVCRGVDITDEVGKMFVALAENATVRGLVDAEIVEAFTTVAALAGWARDLDEVDTDPPGFPEGSGEERGTARVRWLVERKHAIADWIARTRAVALARMPVETPAGVEL